MANSNNYLRPEARAVHYWRHHARARKALDFIIRALEEAADRAKESKKEVNEVDPNRASRIIFVSGEPGSGKSTLYLTLRAMLGHEADEFSKGYKGTALKDLNEIQWLDTLDLEVVGDEGENLLAAVLVRIFRKLEESKLSSKQCEGAIKKLEELATDIGIAWDGNLSARAGALDPDTFSMEVMRTQRARLGVNERLKEALDEISINHCCGCNEKTLFLLPVDDFYLKPTASLHLLRLLRMISIPRLFFLVMGDIDTVEALFIEKSLADWTAVAGKELFINQSDRLGQALSRARELRARYLRKLLPPGQRADIEAMDWHEARDFECNPLKKESDQRTLERVLGEVTLDSLDSPIQQTSEQTESLLMFLVSPPFSYIRANGEIDESVYDNRKKQREERAKGEKDKGDAEEYTSELELRKPRSAYTALQILDATPREIMDLSASLREVLRQRNEIKDSDPDSSKTPFLLLCVRDIVNQVKEEQSFLDAKEQNVLDGVLPTRHYSPQVDDIIFAMDRLCLKPAARKWQQKKENLTLWFRKHRSWDLGANRQDIEHSPKQAAEDSPNTTTKSKDSEITTNHEDPFGKLPPRPAAWFILLHDLAWKWNPESLSVNLIEKLCKDLNSWAISDEKVKKRPNNDGCWPFLELIPDLDGTEDTVADPSQYFAGWAVWLDGSTYRHLPVPEFQTFREIDQFLYVWSRGLGSTGKSQVDDVISLWALAGWTIISRLFENFASKGDDWFNDFSGIKSPCSQFSEIKGAYRKLFDQFKTRFNEKRKEQHQGSSDQTPPDFEYSGDSKSRLDEWVGIGSEENQTQNDKGSQ